MSLKEEFEKEKKILYSGTKLLFETNNKNYIIWLENKINHSKKCSLNKSFNNCSFHSDNKDGCLSCNHFESLNL